MDSKHQPYIILVVVCLFLTSPSRAQDDNPLNDPDLKDLLKQAAEMQKEDKEFQKQNPTSLDTKKKLAELEAQAKEEEARQQLEGNVRKKNRRPR